MFLSKSGNALTDTNLTLGSNLRIDDSISSLILDAVKSSKLSNNNLDILEPKFSLKGFSPGNVNTIFFIVFIVLF
mgnify:CR=1 FL=1